MCVCMFFSFGLSLLFGQKWAGRLSGMESRVKGDKRRKSEKGIFKKLFYYLNDAKLQNKQWTCD